MASGRLRRIGDALVPLLLRRRHLVLLVAAALTIVGGLFTVRLYADLRSGFEELLPSSAPSVAAAHRVGPRLANLTQLAVVLQGSDGDALEHLADDLAARIRRLPRDIVASVEYKTDEQRSFLQHYGGFYLSVEDLDTILERIDARLDWEQRRQNPLANILGEELGPPPSVDFSDIERKYPSLQAGSQFRKSYYQTPDGRLLVLLVRPPSSATGLAANKRVLEAVRKEIEAVAPSRYDPSIRVGYGGEVATLVEEQSALVSDLLASTTVVVVLVVAALWVYFRRWTAILAICASLVTGCALSFGACRFLVGHLNANTAFLGSIVVGNGINVSIIVVARFLEERRRGRGFEPAVLTAWRDTLAPTFVASFGAGLAYLSLAVTRFRGFSQFGVIGGLGMSVCWITAYLLLPSLLAVFEGPRSRPVAPRPSRVGAFARWLNARHGRAVQIVSAALVALAAVGIATYRGPLVEYDLSKLGAAESDRSGAQYWGRRVDEVFRLYLTPIVIHGATPNDLTSVVAELEAERARLGPEDPLREVQTLATVLPDHQGEKLPRLQRLRETLTDARIARLDPELQKKVLALRPPPDLHPVTIWDLPEPLRRPFVERDGTVGRIALAYPKKLGRRTLSEMEAMVGLIRGAISRSGANAMAVGQALLFMDVVAAVVADSPRATVTAFAAVVGLVLLTLRRVRPAALVIGGLMLGAVWLVGAAAWARVRLDFLNFVVLPITFGIGVDYAVNIVQRWRTEGSRSIGRVLRGTGSAVALCSLTTIIGYGSLLAADNRALRGFGFYASLGELACITAALVALPAWLRPRAGAAQLDDADGSGSSPPASGPDGGPPG